MYYYIHTRTPLTRTPHTHTHTIHTHTPYIHTHTQTKTHMQRKMQTGACMHSWMHSHTHSTAAPAHDLGLSHFVESCLGRRLIRTHTHTHTHKQGAIEISTLSTSHAAFRMMTSGEFDVLTPHTRFICTRNERLSPCRPLKDLQGVKKQPASPRTLQVEKRWVMLTWEMPWAMN
jgi:hypothetical protein